MLLLPLLRMAVVLAPTQARAITVVVTAMVLATTVGVHPVGGWGATVAVTADMAVVRVMGHLVVGHLEVDLATTCCPSVYRLSSTTSTGAIPP